jgi:hypothetical protein
LAFSWKRRSRQHSRAAHTLLAAANDRDGHWTHHDIRAALLWRHAIELDDCWPELVL